MILKRIYTRIKYNIVGHCQEFNYLLINRHNKTRLHGLNYPNFDFKKVKVGKRTYGTLNVYMFGNDGESLEIGSYCSIGPECVFLLSGEHDTNTFSTFPTQTMLSGTVVPPRCKGKIKIEDDVWMGYGVTVLSGVHIGKGAIIGAKSLVVKDVPEYSIVAGNPARIIRKRFSDDIIRLLKKIDLDSIDENILREIGHQQVDESNIQEIMTKIEKK